MYVVYARRVMEIICSTMVNSESQECYIKYSMCGVRHCASIDRLCMHIYVLVQVHVHN